MHDSYDSYNNVDACLPLACCFCSWSVTLLSPQKHLCCVFSSFFILFEVAVWISLTKKKDRPHHPRWSRKEVLWRCAVGANFNLCLDLQTQVMKDNFIVGERLPLTKEMKMQRKETMPPSSRKENVQKHAYSFTAANSG